MSTPKMNLPKITGNMTADIVRDLNALADAVDANAVSASDLTKGAVGLGNVDNVKQASKTEFDAHLAESASYEEYEIALSQSIENNVILTLVLDTKTQIGTKSYTTVNNGIITVNETGVYEISISVVFTPHSSISMRQASIASITGSVIKGCSQITASPPNATTVLNANTVSKIEGGSTFRLVVSQISGITLDVMAANSTRLKIRRVG